MLDETDLNSFLPQVILDGIMSYSRQTRRKKPRTVCGTVEAVTKVRGGHLGELHFTTRARQVSTLGSRALLNADAKKQELGL